MANVAMNQFKMNVVKGQIDLRASQQPISCQVDATEAGSLVPGQAVKLVPGTVRGVPKVVACATDADDVFGFVVYDVKSSSFVAGDRLEILPFRNGIMYMQSSAAIAQGAEIAIVIADQKVVTATAGDRIVGRAFDGASAADQLIRVVVDLPGAVKA